MPSSTRARKSKTPKIGRARRLAALIFGLRVTKILKTDDRELVIEFEDGTRLLVKTEERLDISVR
jgi:hypothetical protein